MSSANDNPNNADELLSAYLDGELTAAERTEVERRLADDPDARRSLDELRRLSATLRGMPVAKPEPSLVDEVLRRVQEQHGEQHGDQPREQLNQRRGEEERPAAWAADKQTDPIGLPGAASVSVPFGRSGRGWVWAGLAATVAWMILTVVPDDKQKAGVGDLAKNDAAAEDRRLDRAGEARDGVLARAPLEIAAAPTPRLGVEESAAGPPAASEGEDLIGSADGPAFARRSMSLAEAAPTEATPAEGAVVDGPLDTGVALGERRRGGRSGGAIGGGGGGFGGGVTDAPTTVAAAETAPTVADAPQLVVRVELGEQAFRENFVDRLLVTNGIAIEEADPSLSARASKAGKPAAAPTLGRATRSASAYQQANVLTGNALAGVDSADAASAPAPAAKTDALLVDAPAARFAACLGDLWSDELNCKSMEVFACPTSDTAAKPAPDNESPPPAAPLTGWESYNRQSDSDGPSKSLALLRSPAPAALPKGPADETGARATKGGSPDSLATRPGLPNLPTAGPSSTNRLPAPSDASTRLQALVIIEQEAAPAQATKPEPE